ncbi:MAG: alpha/beta hydrolase domain-containing protein [Candidatus Brevundimonas colombiensis]|uniref:Alpha/beta hydrolase domain-containing protein n=1 Tax=Candidatus Brevundimonas colombiensis TaxID=3121376 RepID=A0AAJ5X5K5_9CAUL|nr:alpha/beta hydrolase domain-containing protein [Brevundimonas sp.]WEK41458.1 MAG: alpha/beta hydrolase domain-containing protein [Brevundimonas sp.]
MKSRSLVAVSGAALLSLAPQASEAEIVRVQIDTRAPIAGEFGAAGGYELLTGHVFGELDPNHPSNAIITDLDHAPRNARGRVEYSATFALSRPADPAKASGFLFYDVPNRGNFRIGGDADGHIHLVSGWQGDIAPSGALQTLTVPTARGAGGKSLTGPILVRFVDAPAGATTLPIRGGIGAGVQRPHPASLDTHSARLVRKRGDHATAEVIAPDAWAFGDCTGMAFPGTPDPTSLCLKEGFDPAFAYELTYTGKDPLVLGVGYAATRDLVSFLRYSRGSAEAVNPIAGQARWTIGVGVSQAGNYLRGFLHLGFNADEAGRIVFDGLNPQIAARHTPLNFRFAVPGGAAQLYEAGSEGPLWWATYDDVVRGRGPTSLQARCTATRTCPRIFETFTSAEFWGLRMSPNLVGMDAVADLPLPDNVRRYYFPGTTHGGGPGGFDSVGTPTVGCVLPGNPNPTYDTLKALTVSLTAWVAQGVEPPPSVYPTLASGELVEPTTEALGFPTIPGVPSPDGKINSFLVYDFGAGFQPDDLTGVMSQVPPTVVREIPQRAPRVDADGNERVGVKSALYMAPLGSYLGWNQQASGYYAGQGCGFQGGFIPFHSTRAEREAAGDPRLSLEERYRDHAGYVAAVRRATRQLVDQRFLLPADAARLITEAEASSILRPTP